jgi:signal transduction histidine kinase
MQSKLERTTLNALILVLIIVAACVAVLAVAVTLWPRAPSRRRVAQRRPEVVETSTEATLSGVQELLDRMSEGVVLLDSDLSPRVANAAARALLGATGESLGLRVASTEVLSIARRAAADKAEVTDMVRVWYPRRRHLRVRAAPLSDGYVVVVVEDITEELRIQRLRREFVAHASHELKSPVAGLQTLAEAIRQAVHDDPDMASKFAERVEHEAQRLSRLIADLLDLSRLEDPADVSQEPVDVSAISIQQLEAVRNEAEGKAINLTSSVEPNVFVEGDKQQLSLMLRNLLDNAVRYTPSGGSVRMDVRREDHQAIMSVSDTGIGIPLEAQERIFERFYRVDRARSRDKGGTGLGLAIVKHAVELHGGVIELDSELEQGSTFRVRLQAVEEKGLA